MKAVRDWSIADISTLPIGEFDWLEIKGRKGLDLSLPRAEEHRIRATLSKALSAFANSGGGQLVYGLENPETLWQVDDGGIALDMRRPGTREWLEDIIPNLVDPPLRQFNVYVFSKSSPDLTLAPNQGIIVIDVADSEQAPHQANDHCYYGRIGGKSHPLNHRFVSDIFHRRRDPAIELSFVIQERWERARQNQSSLPSQWGLNLNEPKLVDERTVTLAVTATNKGRVYAQYVNVVIDIPATLIATEWDTEDTVKNVNGEPVSLWEETNTRRDIVGGKVGLDKYYPDYGPSWFDPLLPGLSQTWEKELPDDLDMNQVSNDLAFHWRVYADNTPERSGVIRWIDIPRMDVSR